MRKYGKWVLTLGLLAATPGLTLAAGPKSDADEQPAAETKSTGMTENQRVANEIAKAMRGKRIQGENISIEFKNGVATVSGSVTDAKMKEKANDAVSKVDGVKHVDNRLTFVERSRSRATFTRQAPAQPAEKEQAETQQAATRKAAARPAATREAVAPAGGVVPANHTDSSPKGNRVQQVNGEIAAPPSANQEVANQIGAALTSANLDGYDITIRYNDGVAVLDGGVQTPAERAIAYQVVSAIPGVRSVANRLTCAQEPVMAAAPQGQSPYAPRPGFNPASYRQGDGPMPGQGQGPGGMPPQGAMPMGPGMPMPPTYGHPGAGASQAAYNGPNVPDYAWPSYAQYPNVAAVNYPQQYSASAWPYIGPFYPYPQVPMGWRDATLRWDDGQWNLMFRTRTDKWWWYFNPTNW